MQTFTLNDAEELRRTIAVHPWRGVAGHSDRAVYAALVSIAEETRSMVVGRSQRSLAEMCGMERATVGRALARLAKAGLISPAGDRTGRLEAARYKLLVTSSGDANSSSTTGGTQVVIGTTGCRSDVHHNAFTRGALPVGAHTTWHAASTDQWLTTAGIAERCPGDPNPRTIRNHLIALHAVGLVDRRGDNGRKWMRIDRDDQFLQRYAENRGTAGTTARRARRHDEERLDAQLALVRNTRYTEAQAA